MIRHEIKPNNRIQIEIEHENPVYRSIKGIVIGVTDDEIVFLTDFGVAMEIDLDKVLSFATTNFPKPVSDVLQELRNHHEAIFLLKQEILEHQNAFEGLKDDLFDAHFLSKYNIIGAKARLEHSIPDDLIHFTAKDFEFQVLFEANSNEQIEMFLSVRRKIDYPQLDLERDMDKILRVHAPDVLDWLKKIFRARTYELKDQQVLHIENSLYAVRSRYKLCFDVNKDTFLDFREQLFKGLNMLKN